MMTIDYTTPYISREEYLNAKGIDLAIELYDNDDGPTNKVDRFIKDITNFVMDYLFETYQTKDMDRYNSDFSSLQEFRRKRFHDGMIEQINYVLNNGLIHLDAGINADTGTITDFSKIDINRTALRCFHLGAFCNVKRY